MLIRRFAIIIMIVLVLWQLIVELFHLPFFILPTPLNVIIALKNNATLILTHLLPTLLEACIGLMLGIFVGMIIALLMIIFKPVRYFFVPAVLMSQAIPTFALAPLFVLWFGYGMSSKIVTVVLMLFFPVTKAFYDGLKQTPPEWLDMAHTMSNNQYRILWYIRIPSALPNLATGIRLATIIAPLGAVMSEWIGSSDGLGYLILHASAKLETDLMFACIVTLMVASLILFLLIDKSLSSVVRT